MPTYTARCNKCEAVTEYVASIKDCQDCPGCNECGGETVKVILHAPKGYVLGKFEAFKSTVDGSVIRNSRELREHNLRNDVVSLADGYGDDKVKSGDFNKKKQAPTMPDLKQDLYEATQMINNGYRPTKEVQEDE